MPRKSIELPDLGHVPTKLISHLWGVVPATVSNWRKAGCPTDERGLFDVGAVILWREGRLRGQAEPAGGANSENLERWRRARAVMAELDLARARGKVIDAATEEKADIQKILVVKNGLLGMAHALAPQLENVTARQAAVIVGERVRELIAGFAGERV